MKILNKKYKKYQKKIKIFNYFSNKILVPDPYRMDNKRYFEVMENINKDFLKDLDIDKLINVIKY